MLAAAYSRTRPRVPMSRSLTSSAESSTRWNPLLSLSFVPMAEHADSAADRLVARNMLRFMGTQSIPAGDHRSQVVEDAGRQDEHHMRAEKSDEREHQHEMPQARELTSPERLREPREPRVKPGRERKPAEHDQRREHEEHQRVRELLERIVLPVGRRFFAKL